MSIWAKITGFLGILVAGLFGALQSQKRKEAQVDRDRAEASQKTTEKATEALIKGVTNESSTDNPRDYKF